MILYEFRHPKSLAFLTSSGLVGSDNVCPLPDLEAILRSSITSSVDDQNYVLIPMLMEVLAKFYPAQDTQFTLNEYITSQFPERSESSYSALLR